MTQGYRSRPSHKVTVSPKAIVQGHHKGRKGIAPKQSTQTQHKGLHKEYCKQGQRIRGLHKGIIVQRHRTQALSLKGHRIRVLHKGINDNAQGYRTRAEPQKRHVSQSSDLELQFYPDSFACAAILFLC